MSLIKTTTPQITNLGAIATVVRNIWDTCDAEIEDAGRFGAPSEINALIYQHAEKRIVDALASFGLSPEVFNAEMDAHVSGRWLFFNGWHEAPESYK